MINIKWLRSFTLFYYYYKVLEIRCIFYTYSNQFRQFLFQVLRSCMEPAELDMRALFPSATVMANAWDDGCFTLGHRVMTWGAMLPIAPRGTWNINEDSTFIAIRLKFQRTHYITRSTSLSCPILPSSVKIHTLYIVSHLLLHLIHF